MVRTQIQLTEDQAKSLRQVAAERKVSMAEVIRLAVDELLRQSSSLKTKKERALLALGRFHSGLKDVSAEHDKYLGEAFAN